MNTNNTQSPGLAAALDDLHRDFAKILPPDWRDTHPLHIRVTLDPSLPPETFRIELPPPPPLPATIAISGADELGAIYGIYEFSHRFLGVDPLWFWKDIEPAPLTPEELRARLATAPRTITSPPPLFRYRGWFINDEDLLSTWPDRPLEPGRQRFRDWPRRAEFEGRSIDGEGNYETRLLQYYTPIAAPEVMAMVFEALLRLRGNLIIPASFNDLTNPPEADLIRAAIRRGLYVSQHHVEPLGVSHFAYETWCSKNNYTGAPFSYREAPGVMRACWRDHARLWHDIAGDRIIWQIGLRGRGDRPLWNHDPAAQARAGEFIAAALADQLAIIRETDPRPAPRATLTLWLEGAELVSSGQLRIPSGVTCVFADHHLTQELQDDFNVLPRDPQNPCGVYYHAAVWLFGPHLVQGPPPSKIDRIIRQLTDRGDTRYALLNVSNLREHVMAAQCFMEQVAQPSPSAALLTDAAFLARWSPAGLAPLHQKLLDAIPEISPGFRLYDGAARRFIFNEVHALATGNAARPEILPPGFPAFLDTAGQALAALLDELRAHAPRIAPRHRSFFQANLVAQTTILLGLYRALAALLQPTEPNLAAAAAGLRFALDGYHTGETGRWRGWYRGDTKMALAHLLSRIESLAFAALPA
ncbi:glycosyl hydrolase 115 family protein [Geminisphaera colitermitum]|uniref:glycosyl hydrolase 115 family protein n=1 Tax=Geminisphaera colitermitum TaxID=1148786 RepID=UPI0001964D30|nr:glycosyl hydrolase 115 family protein [Geminisphaera colitermitum]